MRQSFGEIRGGVRGVACVIKKQPLPCRQWLLGRLEKEIEPTWVGGLKHSPRRRTRQQAKKYLRDLRSYKKQILKENQENGKRLERV